MEYVNPYICFFFSLMKSRLFLLAITWLIPIVVFGQSYIDVAVSDAKSNEKLMGATVMLDGKPIASTDMDGKCRIEVLPGAHILLITYMGYDNEKISVSVAPNEVQSLQIKLKSAARELNLMVVTGSRYEKNLTEETVSMDVVSSQLMQNINAVEASEAVQKTPGVTVTDGQISIRGGSGYSYGVGSRVSILIDGMPILAADQGNADWQYIPVEITDQIEVIKGAASVLYGSGSMNGIVNVTTSWPGAQPRTTISPYTIIHDDPNLPEQKWYSGFEHPFSTGLFFNHSRTIKKNFDLVVGGNYHFERSYLERNDEFRVRAVVKSRYRSPKIEGLSMGINGSFMFENSGRFFLWKNSGVDAYRNYAGSDDKYYFFNIDPYIRYFDKKGNRHMINARLYRKFRYGTGEDINTIANIGYLDYQFQRRFFKEMFMLTAGATGTYGWVQSSIFVDSLQLDTAGNPAKHFQTYSAAVFAQLEFKWKWINLIAGVRYEINGADSLVEGSIPVFRMGANFKPAKATFIRLSYGQSYRLPSLLERFMGAGIGGINVFPNYGLLPEKGWSAELAIKQGFRITKQWAAYADFAIFWMEYDNMIQYNIGMYPPPNVPPSGQYLGFKAFNVEKARIAGFELSLIGQGTIGPIEITPFIGYTYSYPGDLSRSPSQQHVGNFISNMFNTFDDNLLRTPDDTLLLPFRNRHMFRFDLQLNWKNLGLGVNMQYNSFMEKIDQNFAYIELILPNFFAGYVDSRMHRNGDFVFDIRASYAIPKWKGKITFLIKNVANLEYAARPGIMNPTRNFTIRWDFTF